VRIGFKDFCFWINKKSPFLLRSILTVPWIELGGSVEIKCPQSGYYANVEFLTKPFYGGKRNRVSAEVTSYYSNPQL